jgi:hypothetical protein
MQYLLLMYFDETWDQLSLAARQQIYEEQLPGFCAIKEDSHWG